MQRDSPEASAAMGDSVCGKLILETYDHLVDNPRNLSPVMHLSVNADRRFGPNNDSIRNDAIMYFKIVTNYKNYGV